MVLDPRHWSRPACSDGTQGGSYDEWRFQLVAAIAAVDPRHGDVADEVARRTTPYLSTDLPPDEEGKKLISCSPRSLVSRDGREELRKLDAEYRPTYRDRQVALLKRIMHPHLNGAGSGAENIDKLSEWIGKERGQTVKTATLMEEAPPELQEHLRLRSEESGTDYKKGGPDHRW